MINNPDGPVRRVLKFPAIHPYEEISSTTLFTNLISLSRRICAFKSSRFTSNNRNARNSIRLIDAIDLFLQELQDSGPDLCDSLYLSLSELHFIFKRIVFLLEDCTRHEARILLLMKAERVASFFHFSMKDLAVALDVLMLECSPVDVSDEGKDCVAFVIKQARGTRFEVEPEDDRALNLVDSILGRFERRVIPDPIDLKRVLEYLGIGKWSQCSQAVKFLDEEFGLEISSSSEAAFLSSLRGLMVYCRCVFFDVADSEIDGRKLVLNRLNPEDFRCPISLEVMANPVTISTGHTYDRPSILQWFKAGNQTCPNTGEWLANLELVPNLALRRLIRLFCTENGIKLSLPDREIATTLSPGSPAAEGALKMAADFLIIKLAMGTNDEKNKAAYEIRLVTKKSVFHRSCLVKSGAVPYLLNLTLSRNPIAQENAAAALLNLSKQAEAKREILGSSRGLHKIINLVKGGLKMEARQHAAAVLFYLSSVEEYRELIGAAQGAISALVELIQTGNDRGKKNALVAIFGLLLHTRNHQRVLNANLVPQLVSMLRSSEKEELMVELLAVLSALAEKRDGAISVLRAGALSETVEILNLETGKLEIEHCVSLLLALCINGGREVVEVLAKNPSVIGALYSVLTAGTSCASKKARTLIGIFHEYCERSSSPPVARALPREHFIHVW